MMKHFIVLSVLLFIITGCVQTKQVDYSKPLQQISDSISQLNQDIQSLDNRIEKLEKSVAEIYRPAFVALYRKILQDQYLADKSNWKTFHSDDHEFEIKYPQEWKVEEDDFERSDVFIEGDSYHVDRYHFSDPDYNFMFDFHISIWPVPFSTTATIGNPGASIYQEGIEVQEIEINGEKGVFIIRCDPGGCNKIIWLPDPNHPTMRSYYLQTSQISHTESWDFFDQMIATIAFD